MLDRVAMHQTRLQLPGLSVDAKGIALGSRGLILLPGLERLVSFLAIVGSSQSLAGLLPSLRIEVLVSKMGTREIAVSFDAKSPELLDKLAESARVTSGYVFTGSRRHFVQYRDVSAPFGYDVRNPLSDDASYVLYHTQFSQLYQVERQIDLPQLLLKLHLHPETSQSNASVHWILAEQGLGPSLISYFVRSQVAARVGVALWPPASSFDDQPTQRYLFEVRNVPQRMLPLLTTTPGISLFVKLAPAMLVEVGFAHPIPLAALPVFNPDSLVFFRGRNQEALWLNQIPLMGDVQAFAPVTFHDEDAVGALELGSVGKHSVSVRLVPTTKPYRNVRASWISTSDFPLLRQLMYLLGSSTSQKASIAFTKFGALLLHPQGIEAIPVGQFLEELRPGLYIAAGYEVSPALDADVLFKSLGSPNSHHVLLIPNYQALGIAKSAMSPLQEAMVSGQTWAPLDTVPLPNAKTPNNLEVQYE